MRWLDEAFRLLGRLMVFALVGVVAFALSGILLKPVFPDGLPSGPEQMVVIGFAGVFAMAVAHVVVVLALERGKWEIAALGARSVAPRGLLLGTVSGVVVIAVPAALLFATGHAGFIETPPGPWGSVALSALVWLAAPALFEELVARGYAFGVIARSWGVATAIALTSLVFGAAHLMNPNATLWSVAMVTAAGVFLAAVRLATGSLFAAWLAHLAVNWIQGAVLHAPISGVAVFPTPGYRLQVHGPAWLTGGPWGIEGGAATASALLVVTFLLFLVARSPSAEGRAPH